MKLPSPLLPAGLLTVLFMFGCAPVQSPAPVGEQPLTLAQWLDTRAAPYLIRELGNNPRFQGRPFAMVRLDKEDISRTIDDLTAQIRETLMDHLLTEPGIHLVWRPSSGSPGPPAKTPPQGEAGGGYDIPDIIVGIDAAISPVSDRLTVRIRALDISEDQWISGFGLVWKGGYTRIQKLALETLRPDECLAGRQPLPSSPGVAPTEPDGTRFSATLCWHRIKEGTWRYYYDHLVRYPALTDLVPVNETCVDRDGCDCYRLSTASETHGSMPALEQWLRATFRSHRGLVIQRVPDIPGRIDIIRETGFD